jgi:hypothetical protein
VRQRSAWWPAGCSLGAVIDVPSATGHERVIDRRRGWSNGLVDVPGMLGFIVVWTRGSAPKWQEHAYMDKILGTLVLAFFVAGPTVASAQTDVMATVKQFVDAFNKGDTKAAIAMCASQTSILDEFPPHEWHGAGACAKWAEDFDADAQKNGITDAVVALGTPRHVEVTADRAYVVVPVDYTFKQKGKVVKETGSTMTLALQKSAAGWRLTGWAWAKN